jgi:hypothetical protein
MVFNINNYLIVHNNHGQDFIWLITGALSVVFTSTLYPSHKYTREEVLRWDLNS